MPVGFTMEVLHEKDFTCVTAFCTIFSACGNTRKASADAWQEQHDLGLHYLSEGNYEEAIVAFSVAIEIDPKRADAYLGRGDAYMRSGETEENISAALADYEEAIALDETSEEAYLRLADIYICQGDYDKTLACLKIGLEVAGSSQAIAGKIAQLKSKKAKFIWRNFAY